jgi:hypothetical protein
VKSRNARSYGAIRCCGEKTAPPEKYRKIFPVTETNLGIPEHVSAVQLGVDR